MCVQSENLVSLSFNPTWKQGMGDRDDRADGSRRGRNYSENRITLQEGEDMIVILEDRSTDFYVTRYYYYPQIAAIVV